jgi:hypothetical protein
VPAIQSFARLKPVIQAALAQVQHVIKGAIKNIAPMTYRERYRQSTGRDPQHNRFGCRSARCIS